MSRTRPTSAYPPLALALLWCGVFAHPAQALSTATLSATLVASRAAARVDQAVTYTLTLHNSGAGFAHEVRATLTLQPDAAVIVAPSGEGWHCLLKSDTYACTRAALVPAAQAQLTFQIAATCSSPEMVGAAVDVVSDASPAGALRAAASFAVERPAISGSGLACSIADPRLRGARASRTSRSGPAGALLTLGLLAALARVPRRHRSLSQERG